MFPNARNSLRRWSDHHNKIPIPVAVSLYNVLAEQEEQRQPKWFRPEHASTLLHSIRLEIIVGADIVYSNISESKSVRFSWEHLDERIHLPENWWKQQDDIYRSMKFRLSMPDSGAWLLEFSVHPTCLQRLAEIPESLPPNACLVYFSDGSTRVTSTLFQILLDGKVVTQVTSQVEDFSRFEDDVFRTLDQVTPEKKDNHSGIMDSPSTDDSEAATPIKEDIPPLPIVLFDSEQMDSTVQDLKEEEVFLEAIIAREEALLEMELGSVNEDKELLSTLLQEAKDLEHDIGLVENETTSQTEQLRREEFLKQAQCIKLLRELSTIYPISQKGDQYSIRGLALPSDVHATSITEEEVSAALGFICHLVVMMSKYLSIQLRHRIYANSSRSAVAQDGGTHIYPLFTARVVEQEQFKRGMALLDANVDCMVQTRGIKCASNSHLLARLQTIYDHVLGAADEYRTE